MSNCTCCTVWRQVQSAHGVNHNMVFGQGGLYHGRIILPAEYPFKPPSFVMLTPSGRFEIGKKICLSISERHPEHWQPSWSMRTALMALVAFLPTKGKGAIGSLVSSCIDIRGFHTNFAAGADAIRTQTLLIHHLQC